MELLYEKGSDGFIREIRNLFYAILESRKLSIDARQESYILDKFDVSGINKMWSLTLGDYRQSLTVSKEKREELSRHLLSLILKFSLEAALNCEKNDRNTILSEDIDAAFLAIKMKCHFRVFPFCKAESL